MYRYGIFLGLWMLLAGCTPVKVSDVSTYNLSITKAIKEPARAKTRTTIALGMPTASPGFETANMVYVMTPFELQSFTRNRWVAPPAQMLTPIMLQALRAKGYYQAVVPPPLLIASNYRLNLQILRLQQEFLLPDSHLRLEIEAILLDSHTNRVIASKHFTTLIPVNGKTPYAGVLAANQGVAKLTQAIADWCVKHS